MSSSDDDVEFLDASPVTPPPQASRRGNRRKAHTPSPQKIPKKKHREVLADFNVGIDDSDDNDEDFGEGARRNPRGVQNQGKRKRGEASSTPESNDDDEERSSRCSTSSEMENRPPVSVASLADDIPEESSQPTNNNVCLNCQKCNEN